MLRFRFRAIVLGVLDVGVLAGCQAGPPRDAQALSSPAVLTFNKSIAPIVFEHCSPCHRPGQVAPFPLLQYEDVRRRAKQIVAVTTSRVMPPWLPETGFGEFVAERRLPIDQIKAIEQWVTQGAVEGAPSDLPPIPKWPEEWQLGTPDLVVQMPQPYTLRSEETDVFRNFVIEVPVSATRYVRGVEFRPGNARIVHHAVLGFDRTRLSRKADEADPEPGYSGMLSEGVQSPHGHLIGWTPGKAPLMEPDDMSWPIEPGSDLVIQLHMMATGKPESIQPSVGFFLAKTPPTRTPFLVKLGSKTIDIPAGQKDYSVTDTYTLPVDVTALSVYPHAHYLATDMKGSATLPDGTVKSLLWIKGWNFRWQEQYRYATPLTLPRGTTLTMQDKYDNSADNARNPHHPPARVIYGPHSSDEMGDLWLQVLPRDSGDLAVLMADFVRRDREATIAAAEKMLRDAPGDAGLHNLVATNYLQLARVHEAIAHLEEAIRLQPDYAEAHSNLGSALQSQGKLNDAIREHQMALRLSPGNGRVHFDLGNALKASGKADEAIDHFRQAVALSPDLGDAHNSLGVALASQRRIDEAIGHFRRALDINPQDADAHNNLGLALGFEGKYDEAIRHVHQALELRPNFPGARNNLTLLTKSQGREVRR